MHCPINSFDNSGAYSPSGSLREADKTNRFTQGARTGTAIQVFLSHLQEPYWLLREVRGGGQLRLIFSADI